MAGKLSIGIAISSTRDNRLGERVVKYVKKAIEKNHNVVVFGKLMFTFLFIFNTP